MHSIPQLDGFAGRRIACDGLHLNGSLCIRCCHETWMRADVGQAEPGHRRGHAMHVGSPLPRSPLEAQWTERLWFKASQAGPRRPPSHPGGTREVRKSYLPVHIAVSFFKQLKI